MSITGYVPKDYQLTVSNPAKEKDDLSLPYVNVVKEIAILRLNGSTWSEISAPCLFQNAVFNLTFKISIEEIKDHLPEVINPGQVSVQIFEMDKDFNETDFRHFEMRKRNYGKKKTVNFFKVDGNIIEGSFFFAITKDYGISRNQSLLHIAIKIHNVVIKHLVCDIAVYTNMAKIMKADGKLALGSKAQNLFETLNVFWRHEIVFETKKAKKNRLKAKRSRQEEDSDSPEPSSDESSTHPIVRSEERMQVVDPMAQDERDPTLLKRLRSLIDSTRESLAQMEKLDRNNAQLSDEQISAIARDLFASFVPVTEKAEEIIPEPADPMVDDEWNFKDFDGMNFDHLEKEKIVWSNSNP